MPTEPTKPNPPRLPWLYRAMAKVLGPLENAIGLDCRTFTRLASAGLDRAMTFRERVRYRLHWLVCAICRAQAKRNQCLHELLRRGGQDQKFWDDAALSAEAKEKLRNKLAEELKR